MYIHFIPILVSEIFQSSFQALSECLKIIRIFGKVELFPFSVSDSWVINIHILELGNALTQHSVLGYKINKITWSISIWNPRERLPDLFLYWQHFLITKLSGIWLENAYLMLEFGSDIIWPDWVFWMLIFENFIINPLFPASFLR